MEASSQTTLSLSRPDASAAAPHRTLLTAFGTVARKRGFAYSTQRNADIATGAVGPAGRRTHDLNLASFDAMLAVNLVGVFLCLKHEIAQMLAQGGGGAIVNTASVAGLVGLPTAA